MAGSIVSFAMANLWSLLKEEARLLYGVSDQINELCREFERMECFLQDAEARQHKEERVRNWIREIRNLAFRAENIIENYAVKVSSRNEKGFKKVCKRFACILFEARTLHKIGIEIEDIKAKIAGVTTSLDTYGIKALGQAESSSNATTRERERWLRMTYPHEVVEDSFVGMEDDIEQLMSLILNEETHHPVVSIRGMGGSGKTTVARKIYNDERIKGHFDALAWVCISQQCQVRKVLEEIMQQLLNDPKRMEEIKLMGDVRLVGELYKQQKEKKCLVVLDDIWKVVDWDCLQSAFPVREGQGKILVTTRNKEVAEIGFAHNLSYLTQDEGWELLQKKANYYRSVQDSDIEMEREKMGRKMVDKCGYLPLAISVLGGILRKKQGLDEWRKVNKDVEFYLSREGADENKGIMSILSLSYDVLPYHLKQCFLSFGHYPEDWQIGVLGLCFRWMGEGIVLSNSVGRGETLLEVAEEYLSELASRSMVKLSLLVGTDVSGLKYDFCQLHDLMRELCLNKCSQEDFWKKVDFQDESKSEPFSIEQLNPYRLAIWSSGHLDQKGHINTLNQIGQQQNSQHGYLRSVMFMDTSTQGHQPTQMEPSWTQLFNNLKYLRILSFQRHKFVDKATLQSIEKLIHLRFIYFQYCSMDEPPLQLLNLPYLQTVYILNSEWINPAKVPNNVIWKAKRLRHLIFYVRRVDMEKKLVDQGKLRLWGLFELQLLFGFDTGKMEATDLSELSNLRWFAADILNNDSLYLILNCIENRWPCIQMVNLSIWGCHLSSLKDNLVGKIFSCRKLHWLDVDGSLGNKLPKYEPHIASYLISLQLTNSEIVENPMETLEKLPNLKELGLHENAFVGQEMVCNKMGFPKLQILVLDKLHNLEKWRIEEGSMPILSKLEIIGCEKLEMIPDGLRFISTLKELTILSMPLEFVRRIHSADQGNEGADFHKIRHVTSVDIY